MIQLLLIGYLALSIFAGLKRYMNQFYMLQGIGIILIVSIFLVRHKKFGIPGYIIPSVLLLGFTGAIYSGQGIHDVAMLGFPLVIALSGLLIGKGASIYSTIAGIVCIAIIIQMEITNALVSNYQTYTDYGDLFLISVLLVALAAVVYSTMNIISQNISELKQLNEELEERVAQRTAELESTNKDLESFAYSISHDLRAPLRSISGYSNILRQDFYENLDETGQRYLQNICDSTKQMNLLIDEILSLSRVGRQGLKPQNLSPEDLNEMLQSILNGLIALEEERQVKITLNKLPACLADPVLLGQVFVNLLTNAFKFTRNSSEAQIEIGARLEGESAVYYVRDNGAGFDMAHVDKLFEVFQRLHRQDEFEGTGVGLAIVRRIIWRHSGEVWADSAPGKGATFYFTLNMDENQPSSPTLT
jgi:signal transduction histidine kinase